jgi:hypothetical protein
MKGFGVLPSIASDGKSWCEVVFWGRSAASSGSAITTLLSLFEVLALLWTSAALGSMTICEA